MTTYDKEVSARMCRMVANEGEPGSSGVVYLRFTLIQSNDQDEHATKERECRLGRVLGGVARDLVEHCRT